MIAPVDSAPQHEHAPRPLPLFLQLVRDAAAQDPDMARRALRGLEAYSAAPRTPASGQAPAIARSGAASLRDHGGLGSPVVFVPSLINPPDILDLDEEVSLVRAVAAMGRRALLVEWGDARQRRDLSVAGHVEQLLLPLLRGLGEPATLIGYCLGGTMAIAAASAAEASGLVTLASPWNFAGYPGAGRAALSRLWDDARPGADSLGVLPMEVLQASFWSLDPQRTVAKFADLDRLDPGGPQFRRFVALEDWANDGDPLPYPAARELLEDFFQRDATGTGNWTVGGRRVGVPDCPAVHFTATRDRITPEAAAPDGHKIQIAAGHVGMVVGRAREQLHKELKRFLDACR